MSINIIVGNNRTLSSNNITLRQKLVSNNNNSKSKKIQFCCTRMCKIFQLGGMMGPNISYLKGPSQIHFDHDTPNNLL
jgi:hypothetical protein